MKKTIIVLIIIALLISAVYSVYAYCQNTEKQIVPIKIGQTYKTTLKKAEEIPYFADFERTRHKYEPVNGCLTGAYILSDNYCNRSIEKFEEMTSSNHSFYMYTLKVGNPFPHAWVQKCIDVGKTPYIAIIPPDNDPLKLVAISDISKELGKYRIKSFVSVYPDPSSVTSSPEEYKEFFSAAKNFFAVNSPETSLVWLCGESITRNSEYFCENADWAGIFLYKKADFTAIIQKEDEFNKFYYKYQSKLPLMVFYGVSHYSSITCRYYTPEASAELTDFYSRLSSEFPCIKAVCYMDFDGNTTKKSADNFLITDTDELLISYSSAVCSSFFVPQDDNISDTVIVKIRQPYNLMKHNEKIYFPLKYYFKNYNNYDIIYINGEKYLPYTN